MNSINISLLLFLFLLTLYVGKFLLLPLFLALFIYIIIKSLSQDLSKLVTNIGIKINNGVSIFLVFLISFFICYFSLRISKANLNNVLINVEQYQQNLFFFKKILTESDLNKFISLDQFGENVEFLKILKQIMNYITNFAGNFSLVFVYLIFLLLEEKFFEKKIIAIAENKNKIQIFHKINSDIYNYFRIKIFTSFLTGISTFVILYFLGNDLYTIFGVITFFLNFIPYIGSLLSILLPTIFSFFQFMDPLNSFMTLIFLLFIQLIFGNFLEPRLMGKTLNLSPLILMIFLSLMGKIWGVSGMFLSVPIMVVLLIILNNFKETKKIAIFLSEKGISK
tara:strand:+ start:199 stop:1209 length:1011 start_codon:yes stop_codon:yes gene_type:complete